MANGKNTGLQYRPLQGDISADILNHEDQEFKYRAEKRLIDDRTKAQVDAENKKKEKEAADKKKSLEDHYIKGSGFNSHDEAIIELLQGKGGIFEQVSELEDQIKIDPQNTKLLAKQLTLQKSIENIRGLRDGMVARGQTALEGIKGGKFSQKLNKGFIDNYNAVINDFQYKYKILDTGEIVVDNLGYDPDGDGIPNELTLNDVWDPEKMKLAERFDVKGWVAEEKTNFAILDKTTDNGITSHQVKGFDLSKWDDLLNRVDETFGNSLETMTDKGKSYIEDVLGLDHKEMTSKKFKEVREDFANRFKNAYAKTDLTKVDGGTALANKKYNDENVKGISFVESKQYGKGRNAVAQRYSFNSPYVIKGTSKTDNPSTLYEIRYDEETGNVVLMGEEYVGKTSTNTSEVGGESPVISRDYSEYKKAQDNPKNTKTTKTTSTTKDSWKPITIADKTQVTAILTKVMGINSYEEIVNKLKKEQPEEEEELDEYGVPIVKQ